MQYKSIYEQNETFISILKQNNDLMTILDYISELKLPNFYIAAGSVFQTIWNYYDNKPLNYGIKDIDIIKDAGIIIESPGFLPNYSAFKNLKFLTMIKDNIGDEQIKSTLISVGLDPESKKVVGKFSLGMRQRLGIAQAIMENPHILILDEPMNGLDKRGVEDIRKILMDLKKKGKLILLASHNPLDIDILCDCVYELDAGTIVNQRSILPR